MVRKLLECKKEPPPTRCMGGGWKAAMGWRWNGGIAA